MSDIYLPTIDQDKKKIIQKHNNTPIALIYFDTVTIQGENKICKKIRAFYVKLTEKFTKWINTDFEKYAQNCFEADTHPRKKYRYTPIELKYTMTSEIINQHFLAVDTKITLSKRNNVLSKKQLKHIWNLKTGNLHTKKGL